MTAIQADLFESNRVPDPPQGPFRLALRAAAPGEVARLNETRGLTGARRLEPAPAAIERISDIKSPSTNRLWSWVQHPDERVAISLVNSGILSRGRWSNYWAALELFRRAHAETEVPAGNRHPAQDPVVWTPLLDAIAHGDLWPYAHDFTRSEYIDVVTAEYGTPPDRSYIPPLKEHLSSLTAWIRTTGETSDLQPLLRFRSRAIHERVAKHAKAIDESLFERLVGTNVTVAPELATNPFLEARLAARLKDLAFDSIRNLEEYRSSPYWNDRIAWRGLGATILLGLAETGNPLTQDDHARLIEYLKMGQSEGRRGPGDQAMAYYRKTLQDLPDEHLLAVIPWLDDYTPYSLRSLLKAGPVTIEVARCIARHSTDPKVRGYLAEAYVEDPEIFEILSTSRSGRVAKHLLRGTEPDQFPKHFKRVAQHHPSFAAEVLSARVDEVAGHMDRTDLVPLLESEDPEARLKAVQVISQLGPDQNDRSGGGRDR